MEEYRDIDDFPNYQVSNLGNVRNKTRGNVLKPRPVKKAYDYICYEVSITHTDGKQRHGKIHRLVANAFIPKVEGKLQIDHIDRNSANNNVNNLRWCNRSENNFNTNTRRDNKIGEKNIYQTKQRPNLFYVKKVGYKTKSFDTLEEAIEYRNNNLI